MITKRKQLIFLLLFFGIYYYWTAITPADSLNIGPGLGEYCLPACAYKVLKFWKAETGFKEIKAEMNACLGDEKSFVDGIFQVGALASVAENHGLSMVFRSGSIGEVEDLVTSGIPVIIHCFDGDCSHVMVLTGFRFFPRFYTFSDSDSRDYKILSKSDFARIWSSQNNEFLVIAPSEKIPAWCTSTPGFKNKTMASLICTHAAKTGAKPPASETIAQLNALHNIQESGNNLYYSLIGALIADQQADNAALVGALERAIEIKPDYEKYQFILGKLRYEHGQHQAGVRDVKAYLSRQPTDTKSKKFLAEIAGGAH